MLESSGNMTGTASKTVSLDGTDVELKAKNGLTENGANVDIKANGMLNAQASGNTVIKGAMVQIN